MNVLLIDSKWFLFRSLTAKFILTHNDIITNSYYNILSSIKSISKKFSIDNVVIMCDSSYSFRREIYPEYKIKRSSNQDENLIKQKSIIDQEYSNIKKVLKDIGFALYNKYGLEADDIFALYCQQYSKGNKIYIATKDNDILQLLTNDNIIIYDPKEKIQKTRKWFIKEYGITPEQWITVKAVGGCHSDNVKSIIDGINFAEKTAIKWVKQELNKNSETYKKIERNIFDLKKYNLNLKLVELPFKQMILRPKQTKFDIDKFVDISQKFGFQSFLKDLNSWREVFCK